MDDDSADRPFLDGLDDHDAADRPYLDGLDDDAADGPFLDCVEDDDAAAGVIDALFFPQERNVEAEPQIVIDGLSDVDADARSISSGSALSDAPPNLKDSPNRALNPARLQAVFTPKTIRQPQNLATPSPLAKPLRMCGASKKLLKGMKRKASAAVAKLSLKNSVLEAKLHSTAGVWNRSKLQNGATMPRGDKTCKRRQRGNWIHPAAWTPLGAITLAFEQIGAVVRDAKGLRRTRRELDAVAIVSLSAVAFIRDSIRAYKASVSLGVARPKWLLIDRALDATPLKVRFGVLKSVLAPFARFWFLDKVGNVPTARADRKPKATNWRVLRANEYLQQKSVLPDVGTVELLGQDFRFTYPSQSGNREFPILNHQEITLPSKYVERCNASTLFRAFDGTVPELCLEELFETSKHIPLIAVAINSDVHGANERMKHHIEELLAKHNQRAIDEPALGLGVIVLLSTRCVGHVLRREFEHITDPKQLMGKLYDTFSVWSLPSEYALLVKELTKIVQEDLEEGFHPGLEDLRRLMETSVTGTL